MSEDIEYFKNKHPERTYISKAFSSFASDNRKLRYISKVFDEPELHEYIEEKNEVVLHVTPGERQEVKALFYEDSREIKRLTIQRFSHQTDKPYKQTSFTFSGESIGKIFNLLRMIRHIPLENDRKSRLDNELIDELFFSNDDKKQFLRGNLDLVQEIAENNVTKSDIVALTYRKNQLEIFKNLLYDENYFQKKEMEWKKRGKEAVWQQFFEDNPWIFGYGLNYIYLSQLDKRKLELVVSGYNSLTQSGKRVDALMKTRGLISSLCFVEIKTHKTPLLHDKPYRPECWRISSQLGGSVSQIQKTVQKATNDIQTKIDFTTSAGSPTGETTFLYQPKSFIVIGSLEEFIDGTGVNEQKFSSFELFRRNISSPEIITFDELLERANFIVQSSIKDDNLVVTETDVPDNFSF